MMVLKSGITHNSDGVTFDGINGFGNTHLIPSSNFALAYRDWETFKEISFQR